MVRTETTIRPLTTLTRAEVEALQEVLTARQVGQLLDIRRPNTVYNLAAPGAILADAAFWLSTKKMRFSRDRLLAALGV